MAKTSKKTSSTTSTKKSRGSSKKRVRRSTAQEAQRQHALFSKDNECVVTNVLFSSHDKTFKACCAVANINPTKRQASKFRSGKGAAFAALRSA